MLIEYKKVSASNGLSWFSCGWTIFKQNVLTWILMTVVFIVLSLLGIIPLVGALIATLLMPVLSGGIMMAVDKSNHGERVTVSDLFLAFQDKQIMRRLLTIGAIGLAIMVLLTLLFGMGMGSMMMTMDPEHMQVSTHNMGWLGVMSLLSMLISLTWWMALMFAVPLVALNQAKPVPALKRSIRASLSNWLPLLIYGLIASLLLLVAIIPIGLGLLLVMPLLFCSVYCAFKDIFPQSDASIQAVSHTQ